MVDGKKRGMYRKRSTSRRTRSKSSKGLTKTEKKEVKTIAKKAINKMVESKYFNVNATIINSYPSPVWQNSSGVNSEISTWGFMTGARTNTDSNNKYKWGVDPLTGAQNDMTTLNMTQVFRDNNSVPYRQQFALEGLSCRPAYNEVQWLFERPQATTTSDRTKAQPYQIRMIRLVPRATKTSALEVNPNDDCFLNVLNEPFGPASASTGGDPVFTRQEFFMAKVNSRRYKVIQDSTFNMLPSSIMTEVASTTATTELVNNPSTMGCKIIKTKHNLGTELHYRDPNSAASSGGSQYPNTGFEPEFVLFLVGAIGGIPSGSISDDIKLSARPVSTFKDA